MPDRLKLRAAVFDSLEEQIAVLDRDGVIIDVNRAWTCFGEENGGRPERSGIGCNYLDVMRRAAAAGDGLAGEAAQGIAQLLGGGRERFYHEYPCHSPTRRRWFLMRAAPLRDDCGGMFVVAHADITQRKLAEEEATRMALHDPLTGLANRRYFNEFLAGELRRCQRDTAPLSLAVVDIDHFKDYNDALGHPAGDQCLKRIAQALQSHARRPGDLAARLGGDEFALVLGNTGQADARAIAEAVRAAIEALRLAYGAARQASASIGVATALPHQRQAPAALLRRADRALYGAKAAGRNRVSDDAQEDH